MRKTLFLLIAWSLLFGGKSGDEINRLIKADQMEAAFALSEKYAASDDPEGHQALGWFYDQGKFVVQDKGRAADHFRKCADAGLKHCQWKLGVKLDTGDGVAINVNEAFRLLTASAAQNYGLAHASLGLMYATGRGTPVNYSKSMESYRTAAKLGEAHGFFGIGVLYRLGQGVPRDDLRAFAWFLIAHFQGDGQAQGAMNNVGKAFSGDDLQRAVDFANVIVVEFGLGGRTIKTSDFELA
jgi:TPR repeat protein